MSIHVRMIIISLSIVPYLGFDKTSNLAFIGFYNVRLESYWVIMTTSLCAPSWLDKISVCALTVFVPYPLNVSDLCRNFIIGGYVIFPSLHCTISYPRTISAYNLFLSIPSPSVSTLYYVSSPSVSILD